MSININVGNKIPAEVVEVGQEISVDQLAAVTSASSPSAANPFTTATHTHVIANVTGLQTALDAKASTTHTHTVANVTGLQAQLDGKSSVGHLHTIADVTNLQTELDAKALVAHTHAIADTTGLQTALDGKALVAHTHAIADTTGLQTALDGKSATTHLHTGVYAPVTHTHAIADTTGLQTALDGKSATTHLHTGVYAPVTHTHAIADVTGLQTALDSKTSGTGYALLTGATFSGEISAPQIGNLLNEDLIIDAYNDTGAGTHYYHKFTPTGGFILAPNDGYVQAGQYSLGNQGFASYWFYQGDIGRSLKLNQSGLTWDVTKNFNYVWNVGFTFNDKVTLTNPTVDYPTLNIGSVASTAIPANALAGDVWIGTWQMCYKTNNGTVVYGAATNVQNSFTGGQSIDGSTTTPALRVTQRGTGNALVVEDTTTPDTSSFLVNNDGKVYVNYNPANATDTVADFRVTKKAGSSFAAYFDSQGVNDGGSTVQISNAGSGSALVCSGGLSRLYGGLQVGTTGATIAQINQAVSGTGTYTHEIQISMNGNNFRIPCRVV